jgi:hypothetical protein
MKILISGASGLIGSALVRALTTAGHYIVRMVRSKGSLLTDEIFWDPVSGAVDATRLEGMDVVVHLAGENIAARWTPEKKARIRDSRVRGAALLCDAILRLEQPPKTLLCASAVGYYGDRGNELLNENSPSGQGFLAEVCKDWETAAASASARNIRAAHLRFGAVLSASGGALARMLTPFRLGLGGVVGPGSQYMSWIAIDDVVGAVQYILATEPIRGPVNLVAPNPVTNREFTRALGKALSRPTLLPMPAFALRLLLGEMADGLLLSSQRVEPRKLLASGYVFKYPRIEDALRHIV